MKTAFRYGRIFLILAICGTLSGCDDPQVYGSVGFSTYSGGYGSPRVGTSISVGGRIR